MEIEKDICAKYGIELVKTTDTDNWVAARPGDNYGRCGIAATPFEAVCRLLYAIDKGVKRGIDATAYRTPSA